MKRDFGIPREAQAKLELARPFIASYVAARDGLKKLGILRSGRNLQGDYAEWLAAQVLNLDLEENPVQKSYDAVDQHGITYQVKSRTVVNLDQNTSFDMAHDAMFDYLVGVFLTHSFELLQIIRVPYETVRELGSTTRDDFRFRWNKHNAQDPRVEYILPRD